MRIAILGAGCAGLSLASELTQQISPELDLTIVDRRTRFEEDRTWCSWGSEPHSFRSIVKKQWWEWRVAGNRGEIRQIAKKYPYEFISASDFYTEALGRLERSSVDLRLGETITGVTEAKSHITVSTDRTQLEADIVFDSRPTPSSPGSWQQTFTGWFVRLASPPKTRPIPTIIEEIPSTKAPIHFIYSLPFTERRWLVESTSFGVGALPFPERNRAIQEWCDRYLGDEFEVERTESGTIPMAVIEPENSARRLRIGIAGGALRASSGYAFTSIQRHSRQIATAVARSLPLDSVQPESSRHRFLDRVFLDALRQNPDRASEWLLRLFEAAGANGDVPARFLGGHGSRASDFRTALQMPWWPFSKAAIRVVGRVVDRTLGKGAACLS